MLNTLFDTTNFSTLAGLKTNGNASILGNELRLTGDLGSQVGSAFYGSAIALAPNTSFATQFQINIGNGQGTGGADGMTFMLQNSAAGTSAIGRLGGDLGYAGILGNSIAIEFDTYDNGANDINDNHLSILRNGDINTAIVTQTSPIDLNRNLPINAWVDYNGVTDLLEVFLSGTTIKPTAALLATTIDLATALNGSAYFGFSGGTGGLWNTHAVQRWAIATETPTVPNPPPTPAAAGTGNGLKAEYYDNADFTNLQLTRIDPSVNFNWGSGSPDVAIASDTFSARWSGQVLAQYSETYTFYTTGDDGIRLTVNGQQLINGWKDQGPTEYSGTITLVAGQKYNIQLEYYENGGGAVSQLAWSSTSQAKQIIPQAQLFTTLPTPPPPSPPPTPPSPPPAAAPIGNGHGLQAEYFDNADFTNRKVTRIDAAVNFDWGNGSPDAAIAADTFSARWSGQVLAQYSETYTFYTTGDDGIRLTVNGQQLINGWKDQAPTEYSGSIQLIAGQKYDIQLEYFENGGGAVAKLAWSSASQARQIIPKAQLFSKFNYGEALQKSIYFYDAQRSGQLPANNRVAWRGNSALNDGSTVGKDLTGGFYDAGDRIKFSRTIGYTAAMLSWGYLTTPTAYSNSGQLPYLLDNIKWGTDYLLKAFTNDQAGQYEFYTQVGSMGSGPRDDHSNWVIAEVIDQVTDRPAYKINTTTRGSDIAGQAAAALAAASIVFRQQGGAINLNYADLLLSKSEKLFDFADSYRGMGQIIAPNGVAQAIVGYEDTSYYDELVWSATWLHKAALAKNTGYGDRYLTRAEVIWNDPNANPIRGNYQGEQSWQTVDKGAELLLTQLTNKAIYRQEVESYLDWWTIGYNGTRVSYTPDGLAWQYQWGSLRHATTQGFMAIAYSDLTPDTTRQTRYQSFAANQVNYALGENPYGRSYMLGFGNNPMRAVHHSTAYAPTAGWANFNPTSPLYQPFPRYTLYGGLLGGPGQQDQFTEDVTNYVTNEVAIDYNAGLTGVLARLYATKGGNPLTNFPT
jgi:Glycosyl hydrolase family 9/Legume lectin domain/PA14 domain